MLHSFPAIARSAYGKRGERAVSVFLFLLLMGPLSAYFNIAGMSHVWGVARRVSSLLLIVAHATRATHVSHSCSPSGSYIRDTIVTFDHEESHQHEWYTQQVLIMLIMGGGVMFPLSCLKSLRSIAFASLLALFAMAYAVVLILYSFARDATAEGWQWPHIYVFYKPSWSIVSSFAMV